MSEGVPPTDYHSLLSLHHGLRLGRHLRGDLPRDEPGYAGSDPAAEAPTVQSWPRRGDDQRTLRESLVVLEPLDDALLAFYTRLFDKYPHLRSLFPGSIMAQRERLKSSLLHVIDGLDHPERIAPAIEALGRDHRKLGVRPAHFTPFAETLMEALRAAGGDRWRDDFEQAWLRLFWFTARLMIDGAERETSDPPYFVATVVSHERRRADLAVIRVHTRQPYPFRAGQHATLESPRLPHTWRCYSMANPPRGDGVLEFHVRAKGVGGLSDVLVADTAVGDTVRVGPARGEATLESVTGHELLLVAGGTGLAPIKSILGDLGHASDPPPTSLFVGARSSEDLYDLELLTSYAACSPWLRLVAAISDGLGFPHESGQLPDVVARHGPWHGCRAVVAGPRAMVARMLHELPGLGVPAQHIAYDPE